MLAQVVGHLPKPAGQLIQLAQLLVHPGNGAHRGRQVHRHHSGKHRQQPPSRQVRQRPDAPHNGGVDDFHHQQAGRPPHQGEAQADIAPHVERLVGVIPPPLVEQLLQHQAGDPLQRGGENHGTQKQQQDIFRQRLQHPEHNDHPEAVNGTHRAVEKAPVHKPARTQGGIAHLRAPAQEGIDKKDPKGQIEHGKPPGAAAPLTGPSRSSSKSRG